MGLLHPGALEIRVLIKTRVLKKKEMWAQKKTRAPRLYDYIYLRIKCMAEKFQNKYRTPSARLQTWDYGRNASYFVTICTKDRVHYFGDIINGEMRLSEIGKLVQAEWLKTPDLRPDMNLYLGAFIVMPNHFHTIITIGENFFNTKDDFLSTEPVSLPKPANFHADPKLTSPLSAEYKNTFGTQSKNLASIIGGFKAAVTRNARKLHADFAWQTRYHDHIIRDAKSYKHIEDYIRNNPYTWKEDKFYG